MFPVKKRDYKAAAGGSLFSGSLKRQTGYLKNRRPTPAAQY
ncbi:MULTISPECIES: hypothetical protein [Eikenella]|nr:MULTISPECIES: hypothetical protein [Eikenella]